MQTYTVEIKDAYGNRVDTVHVALGEPHHQMSISDSVLREAAPDGCDYDCTYCNSDDDEY